MPASLPRAHEALRHALGARLIQGFFTGLSGAAKLHPQARPERHGVRVLRDLPYQASGREEHLLDVYLPAESRRPGPLPVVLYVHGGGFRILSKDTHWVMGIGHARLDCVVVVPNYRLAPRHPFPAALEDVVAAYEWTLREAPRFGASPGRLVFAGESAGANLITALTLAIAERRNEAVARRAFDAAVMPRALFPACGILEVSRVERFAQRWPQMHPVVADRLLEVSRGYLGKSAASGAELELADPLVRLERGHAFERPLPPSFASVGTRDPLIDDARRLHAAWQRHGAASELDVYPGEVHAFHAFVWRKAARQWWRRTAEQFGRAVATT